MKIAMFGGSFDPVHNAHVKLCNTMIDELSLDKVIVMPAASSPFKNDTKTAAEHRFNMCSLAFKGIKKAHVSDFEIKRGGKSYTVDTLNELRNIYPDAKLYLITGADAFLTLDSWYNADEIFDLAHILTLVRNDDDITVLKDKEKQLKGLGADCTLFDKEVGNISSTLVRDLLKDNKCTTEYMPFEVLEYIKENGLYGCGN